MANLEFFRRVTTKKKPLPHKRTRAITYASACNPRMLEAQAEGATISGEKPC